MEVILRILAGVVIVGLAIKGGWYGTTYGASSTVLTVAMAALFASVSLIKDTLAAVVPGQWERENYPAAIVGTILLVVLTIWGVYTTVSVVSTSKYINLDRTNSAVQKSKDVKSVIAQLEQTLAASQHREIAAIQSDLIALEGKVVDKKSVSERVGTCDPPWKGYYSRTYCPDITKLRAELTAANEARENQKQLQELRLSGQSTVSVQTPDPQAHVISKISGWLEESIRLWNIIAIAFVFEACSGLTLIAAYKPSSRSNTRAEALPAPKTVYKVRKIVVQKPVPPVAPTPQIIPVDKSSEPAKPQKNEAKAVRRLRGGVVENHTKKRRRSKRTPTIPRVVARAGKLV